MQLNLRNPLVFFDLETTGINIVKDRIVEISYVKVFPNGKEETKTLAKVGKTGIIINDSMEKCVYPRKDCAYASACQTIPALDEAKTQEPEYHQGYCCGLRADYPDWSLASESARRLQKRNFRRIPSGSLYRHLRYLRHGVVPL